MKRLVLGTLIVLHRLRVWAMLAVALPYMQVRAQATPCTYAQCALAIAPAWNGLDVVRGAEARRVTGLGFFWAGDIAPVVAGNDSAVAYAVRAVHVRRTAALLTDVGALALGYAAARRLANGSFSRADRGVAIGGGAAFALSVPLQFAADGLLSRSLWWFNRAFARE